MKYHAMTLEDLAIMGRFKWAPYDSEHEQPSYKSKIKDSAINSLCQYRDSKPTVYKSMLEYYAFR